MVDACSAFRPVMRLTVSSKIIANAVTFFHAAQAVSSAHRLAMEPALVPFPAVTDANVDIYAISYPVVTAVSVNICLDVCPAATMPFVTFVTVFKDVKFSIVLIIAVEMDFNVLEIAIVETVTAMDWIVMAAIVMHWIVMAVTAMAAIWEDVI